MDPRLMRSGTIVSKNTAARTVVVQLDGQERLTIPVLRHVDLTNVNAGEAAALLRDRHTLYCIGMIGPAPTVAPPPPETPPTTPQTPVTTVLQPTRTGSIRGGGWRGDTDTLYQGDWTGRGVNKGVATYASPGVAGAKNVSCSVTVRRGSGGVFAATAPTLHLWDSGFGSLGSVAGPPLAIGQEASVELPADWGGALLAGTAAGVGCYVDGSAPYVALDGRSKWSPSMTISITYYT